MPLTVIRQGKTMTIDLPVKTTHQMLIDSLKGRYPSYFVYGPLVFSPVTTEFAVGDRRGAAREHAGLPRQPARHPARRRAHASRARSWSWSTSPMFPHKIAKGYDNPLTKVVKEINGVPVKNLRHLVELLRDSKEKFTIIRFDDKASETIVFNHQEALKATDEILSDNGVRQQASDDLIAVWSMKK